MIGTDDRLFCPLGFVHTVNQDCVHGVPIRTGSQAEKCVRGALIFVVVWSELQNDSGSDAMNFNYTSKEYSRCTCAGMWSEKAGPPCWTPRGQQVLHLRRI